MSNQGSKRWILVAPALGLLAMVLPVALSGRAVRQEVPLFPLLDHAVEHIGPWQFVLLVVAGALVGAVCDRRPLIVGLAVVAALPLAAIAEMFADGTSHNMFPFEFAIYFFYGCLAALGALVAQKLRRRSGGDSTSSAPGSA